MTLYYKLFKAVYLVEKQHNTTRSAFTRNALRDAINRFSINRLEEKHRRGYELHPVNQEEFSVWEEEQDWGG